MIGELSESRMFPSRGSLQRLSPRQVADLAFLYLIAMRILLAEEDTDTWARYYIAQSLQYTDFRKWHSNATDLHILFHGLDPDVDLRQQGDRDLRARLQVDQVLVLRWLRSAKISGGDYEGLTQRLFARLDYDFKIDDGSMRSVRRLAKDWPSLDRHRRELVMTSLLKMLKARDRRAEVLAPLQKLADRKNLIIETAPGFREDCPKCRDEGFYNFDGKRYKLGCDDHRDESAGSLYGRLTDSAQPRRSLLRDLDEDASAGASAAGAIASVAAPLGGIIRRPSYYGLGIYDGRPVKKRRPRKKSG